MAEEPLFPCVKCGGGDPVPGADGTYSDSPWVFQIGFQDAKDEEQGKVAEGDEEICQECVQVIAFRTVEDGNHYKIIHYLTVLLISDPAFISAMWFHTTAFAASLAYKGVGRNVFKGGNDPLFLTGFLTDDR